MTSGPNSPLSRFIRTLASARAGGEQSDGELLERFSAGRDESAFASLVQRHGPMVLGVCRSILNDAHDADDIFQATFLVLVRKARSIGKPNSVGSWLHGVAYRLSVKARGAAARRRTQERQAPSMSGAEADHEAIWSDLRPVLHDEVNRLPERYRKPFVLCYLEGRTNEEAATILGWPKGTVLSSLSRAREQLRNRLTQRGIALSAGLLATLLTEKAAPAAVPAGLMEATVQAGLLYAAAPTAAAGAIAAPVLAYTEGMVQSMFLAKVKTAAAVLVLLTMLGIGSAVLVGHHLPTDATPTTPETPAVVSSPLPAPVKAKEPEPPAKPPEPSRPDKELIRGRWVVVTAQQHGAALDVLNDLSLTLSADDFAINAPRGEAKWLFRRGMTRGRYLLDADARPRAIDLVEAGNGRKLEAIYLLEGDRLTLCVGDPDRRERPLEFRTLAEDRRLMLVLKRE